MLAGAQHDHHLLVYLDKAHIHQDADLGSGWSERGQRFWIASPRLSDKLSFYGLYLYNEGQVRLWPYARANGEHTVDVLRRLRAEWPEDKLIVVWDGASYHRACVVREAAEALNIDLVPLPGYLHAGRGALALAPGGCHLSLLPSHRRGSQPPGGRFRNTPQSGRRRRPPLGQSELVPKNWTDGLALDLISNPRERIRRR